MMIMKQQRNDNSPLYKSMIKDIMTKCEKEIQETKNNDKMMTSCEVKFNYSTIYLQKNYNCITRAFRYVHMELMKKGYIASYKITRCSLCWMIITWE